MIHPVKIGGRVVELAWSVEVSKRFRYRLSSIGGHPTQAELRNSRTNDAAVCRILWALLPSLEISRYPTPEDLFVAIDQESDGEEIGKAIAAIYAEMEPSPEKKSTLMKSPSQESNSD